MFVFKAAVVGAGTMGGEIAQAIAKGPLAGKYEKAIDRESAYERLADSPIERIVVTDTLPLKSGEPRNKINVLTIAPLLANTIRNVFLEDSVSEVFMGENQLF